MARVSISKAAQLAGISRTALYKTYIDQGRITVSSEITGKKYIDTSEILRVFGKLEDDSKHVDTNMTEEGRKPDQMTEVDILRQQSIEAQRRELEANRRAQMQEQEFAKREAWYQSQIQNLTDTMKLLEAPEYPKPVYPRLWWQFWK